MNKRIASLLMSVVLIIITVGALNNPAIVDACDNAVLLENRHPGYWTWLHENALEVDTNQDDMSDVIVYPVSKMFLKDISHDDYQIFKRVTDRNPVRSVIDFGDGSGIDVIKSEYGKIDAESRIIVKSVDIIEDQGNYLTLSKSKGTDRSGINGIVMETIPFSQITDVYRYLYQLRDQSFIISVRDDAAGSWNDDLQKMLENCGLLGGFKFRNSYIAVMDHGNIIYENASVNKQEYQGELNGVSIQVRSSGFYTGSESSIALNDNEYSINHRGLNIVVLQDEKVIDSVAFDTCNRHLSAIR